MSKNGWIIFSVICLALIAGLVIVSQQGKIDVTKVDQTLIQPASAENGNIAEHVYGNANSKVVLVEYGDFQCPGCRSAYPVIKEVTEKYKDKIAFVFRNMPLSTIHPNALAAASAAEAAGLQGKYWEMHNKLFESQNSWKDLTGEARTNYFKGLATEIGVNGDTWLNDINKSTVIKKIDFDRALGQKAGATSTPSFHIGTKNVGDQYFEADKLVETRTSKSQLVWSDATAFENLVIKPALKAAGIATE